MNNTKKKRLKKFISYFLILLVIIASGIYKYVNENGQPQNFITYDKVVTYVKEKEVAKIEASQETNQISITMKDGTKQKSIIPSLDEFTSFVSGEIEKGSKIEFEIKKNIASSETIFQFFSQIIILIATIAVLRRISNITNDNNYDIGPVNSKTKFSDVAGIDEEKEQLVEIVEFLQHPEKYTDMGARAPKGILLNGDPGTGKTLLAKAIAGEAGVPFFQTNGSSFEEKYVGVGASRVRKLFDEAKKVAPCIIFIDEIDSVAQSRYSRNSYSEQTLNQLLAEMDGFDSKENKIIVIAATNHIEVLDSAIIRPGRFDRQIFIPKPDVIAREKILQIHAKNKKLADDISLKEIAKRTVGFSGADLENILNEAAIYAVNQQKEYISKSDIDEAIARVLVGLQKKNAAITDKDKKLTAVHEAGHAIVSAVLRPEVKNFGISIIPRGSAGGYNFFDEIDTNFRRKSDMYNELKVCYGGRAAEKIVFEDISSGASNDFEVASKIAYLMVTRFAMNNSLLVKIEGESDYNKQLDAKRMREAEKICEEAYKDTIEIVESYKSQLLKLSDILYEKEYLSQEEVENFIKENL